MRVSNLFVAATVAIFSYHASAQTVQLPTFSFTTVSTTVMVPDCGAAFLGGIDRAATGRNEFGVPGLAFPGFQSRSIGQEMSSSSMWATVTIHDFDAMDQAILNSPSPNNFASLSVSSGWHNSWDLPAIPRMAPAWQPDRANLAGNWHTEVSAAPKQDKVAAAEADREARRAVRSTEAESYFARGRQAEAEGKPSVARIYYQMALRRATGDFKQQVLARLDVINGRATALAKSSQ